MCWNLFHFIGFRFELGLGLGLGFLFSVFGWHAISVSAQKLTDTGGLWKRNQNVLSQICEGKWQRKKNRLTQIQNWNLELLKSRLELSYQGSTRNFWDFHPILTIAFCRFEKSQRWFIWRLKTNWFGLWPPDMRRAWQGKKSVDIETISRGQPMEEGSSTTVFVFIGITRAYKVLPS